MAKIGYIIGVPDQTDFDFSLMYKFAGQGGRSAPWSLQGLALF